jgi:hypothetical protein
MSKSTSLFSAGFAYNKAAFAPGDILIDVLRVGHLRTPMPGITKLDAQAQWEAGQTIPLMITLMVAGVAAVASQLSDAGGVTSTLWVGVFGLCGLAALTRVGRSYHKVFVSALVAEGFSEDEAESAYQARYRD